MSALPLRNVMLGLDTGVSARFLCNLGVRSINGLRNASLSPTGNMPAQDGFKKTTEILAQLQIASALRVRVEPARRGNEGRVYLSLGGRNPSPRSISTGTGSGGNA